RSAAGKALEQISIGIVDIDEPVTRTGYVIVLCAVLECIGDEEIAIDILDTERGKTGREIRIGETPTNLCAGRWPKTSRAIAGKNVDLSAAEVGREEEDAMSVGAENEALVDGAR